MNIPAVGADAEGKEELDPSILKEAIVVVDDLVQASAAGEINVPITKGLFGINEVYATLSEIITGKKEGMKDIKMLKKATGDTTDNIHNHSPVAIWRNSHVLYITIIMLTLSVIVTLSTFSFSAPAKADSSIEITAGSTEHTIVIPFEKSFLFVANIKNNGSTTEIVSLTSGNNIPRECHLLAFDQGSPNRGRLKV